MGTAQPQFGALGMALWQGLSQPLNRHDKKSWSKILARKKDCLNFTNEAIMLLKTKDRQNERSRTKPISDERLIVSLFRRKASQRRIFAIYAALNGNYQ
jgi:hypothetical protein